MYIRLFIVLTILLISTIASSQQEIPITGIPVSEMSPCDDLVSEFMRKWEIPGLSISIAKDEKLIYSRGFGYADLGLTQKVQPYHLFRIASVSKSITSIMIMQLVEQGKLDLNAKVFGETGILNSNYYNEVITDNRIYSIRIRHLLEHSAGWNRAIPCTPNPTSPYSWNYSHCDPIAFPLHVTSTLGEDNPVSEETLIKFLLLKGLDFEPNTDYAYSNIGYLILGEVIEAVTGLSYENFVRESLLKDLGICDLHIGKNLLEDKLPKEVEYFNTYTTLSCYGNNSYVPWQYGGWNIEAMDAHGGWIASAPDLVKILFAVDGFDTKPDILSSTTLDVMTSPSINNNYYAKGWSVNPSDNWWHFGSLDGTASFWARTSGGFTWTILLNKRVTGSQSSNFFAEFDDLPWNCIGSTNIFPEHDFSLTPTENAKNLEIQDISSNSVSLVWQKGDGDRRIIITKEVDFLDVESYPISGTIYNSSYQFGEGDAISENSYVVYKGDGEETMVSNLKSNTTYEFRLVEYNQNELSGNYPLYSLCNIPATTVTTMSTFSESHVFNPKDVIHYFADSKIYFNTEIREDVELLIYSLSGRCLYSDRIFFNNVGIRTLQIPTEKLPNSGLYIYMIKIGDRLNSGRFFFE